MTALLVKKIVNEISINFLPHCQKSVLEYKEKTKISQNNSNNYANVSFKLIKVVLQCINFESRCAVGESAIESLNPTPSFSQQPMRGLLCLLRLLIGYWK